MKKKKKLSLLNITGDWENENEGGWMWKKKLLKDAVQVDSLCKRGH